MTFEKNFADESKVGGKPVFTAKNEKSSSYDAYEVIQHISKLL